MADEGLDSIVVTFADVAWHFLCCVRGFVFHQVSPVGTAELTSATLKQLPSVLTHVRIYVSCQ